MNFYQGIFGLGPSDLLEPGTTSYLDAVKTAGVSNAMSFELCDDHGTRWLGPRHERGGGAVGLRRWCTSAAAIHSGRSRQ